MLRTLWRRPLKWMARWRGGSPRPGGWLTLPQRLATPACHLFVPPASQHEPLPLLVLLHGCRQRARDFAAATRIEQLATARRIAVLCPEQDLRANQLGCWNWFLAQHVDGDGEAQAIARVVRRVCRRYRFDRTRVYVAGMSAGAAMARVLAVRHGTLFAACATHSGLMYRAATGAAQALSAMRFGSTASPQTTARAAVASLGRDAALVPCLAIHGSADKVVHPRNLRLLAEQFLALDAAIHDGQGALQELPERALAGPGRTCRVKDYERGGKLWLRCCLIEGLPHAWSGGDASFEFNDASQPEATELMWEFLARHRLGSASS